MQSRFASQAAGSAAIHPPASRGAPRQDLWVRLLLSLPLPVSGAQGPSLRWPCVESLPWAGLRLLVESLIYSSLQPHKGGIIIILTQNEGEMKTQRGEVTCLGSHS